MPSSEEAATPRRLGDLTVAQQASILQQACTDASTGVIVFTCEDELEFVNQFQAANELVAFIIEASNEISANPDPVAGTMDYMVGDPEVDATLDTLVATALHQGTVGEFDPNDLYYADLYPIGVQVIMPSGRLVALDPLSMGRRYRCGWFDRPNPRRANPSVRGPLQGAATTGYAAAQLAREWGYSQGFHNTPGRAGGGMTRPQTFSPFFCGSRTFRDHAFPDLIQERTCFGPGGTEPCEWRARLYVQDYTSAPYGEPNPEVWRSGPWPYPEWPAYVSWWHRTR